MAAAFGPTIHVCGQEMAALRRAVDAVAPDIRWRETEPTLEDVFIHLMRGASDNSVGAGA
jgi:ABC-2 type transport system ATP-binding protein